MTRIGQEVSVDAAFFGCKDAAAERAAREVPNQIMCRDFEQMLHRMCIDDHSTWDSFRRMQSVQSEMGKADVAETVIKLVYGLSEAEAFGRIYPTQ